MAFLSSLFGNNTDPSTEYKRFKKALKKNPRDLSLKSQFVKFCLLNRFTRHDSAQEHLAEALEVFRDIEDKETFDLQTHYLVGKYYQEERDYRKAYGVYLSALKRFNRAAVNDPRFKADHSELAYSVALNLMTLQFDPVDPEVEIGFKLIRKSFPLHLKRVEMESEMAKPAPNKERVKKLAMEVQKLREVEEKETASASVEEDVKGQPAEGSGEARKVGEVKAAEPSKLPVKPEPQLKGLFSKLFNELSPESMGLTGPGAKKVQTPAASGNGEKMDSFQIAPVGEKLVPGGTFLAFHDNKWEGPFAPSELVMKGFLRSNTWVCRKGSQQVVQAYEVPDLQVLLKK